MERKRLDLNDRGVNYHQNSLGVFKNGTLYFSKQNLERLNKGDIMGGAFKKGTSSGERDDGRVQMRDQKKERVKMDYQQIMKAKEDNEEFRSGKKWKKARGADGKIHRKYAGGKR